MANCVQIFRSTIYKASPSPSILSFLHIDFRTHPYSTVGSVSVSFEALIFRIDSPFKSSLIES